MKLNLKYAFLLVLFLIFSFLGRSSRIDRGYQALYQYDYFKAKKLFTKALKYNTSAAAQGLAIIFYRNDNPFHSDDSALVYINMSFEKFSVTNQKKIDLYAKYGFTSDSIGQIRQLVSQRFFNVAREKGTVMALGDFIEEHQWFYKREQAIAMRDSLAFFNAVGSNSSLAYKRYMELYPESEFLDLAEVNYHTTLYDEITEDKSLESYEQFLLSYPENPMAKDAEEEVYRIVTAPNTEGAFYQFVSKYPDNHLNLKGWRELYQVFMSEYSVDRMHEFLMQYPDNKIADDVNKEILFADSLFLPFNKDGLYGYMNQDGLELISNVFMYTGFFKEGLAAVQTDEGIGFISKQGVIQIYPNFEMATEFEGGLAIVEKDERLGLIDRNGRIVLDLKYDDIGSLQGEMIYASINEKYGYYDRSGKLRIPHMYDDAYDFQNGTAKISFEEKEGYIDGYGAFLVSPAYERIEQFRDTLYTFEEDGLIGIMNRKCQIYKEPKFSQIGPLLNGLAIAEFEESGEVVYLNGRGDIVIQNGLSTYPNFLLKGEFRHGLAIAMKDGKYGKIDTTGKFIIQPKFENIGIGNGIFPVQKNNVWGLMNSAGAMLIKPVYDDLTVIDKKYLFAVQNDTVGMISPDGNILIPFAFNSIEPLLGEVFIAQTDSGIYLYIGEERVLNEPYDRIGVYNEDYLYLVEEGEVSYYDLKRKRKIEYNASE